MNKQLYIIIFFSTLILCACNLDSEKNRLRKDICNNCPKGETIWSPLCQKAIDNQSLYWQKSINRAELPNQPTTEANLLLVAFDSLKNLYLQEQKYILVPQKDSFQFKGKTYLFSHLCSCSTDTMQTCITGNSAILNDTILVADTIHSTYFLSQKDKTDTISSKHASTYIQQCLDKNKFTKDNYKSLIQLQAISQTNKQAISVSIPLKDAQLYIKNQSIQIINIQYLEQHQFQERSYSIYPFYQKPIVTEENDTLCIVRTPLLSNIEKYHTHKHYYLIYTFL